MILSDKGILAALKSGRITIDPTPSLEQYTSSAVDLRLGDSFKIWDRERLSLEGSEMRLDLSRQDFQKTARAFLIDAACESDGCFVLPPYSITNQHLLATTEERVHLAYDSKLAARVEGRSSFARLGLMVHLTAPTIHAGFEGRITLEIINHGPFFLKLVPQKTRICQLIFEKLASQSGDIKTAFQGQSKASGEK